MLIFTVGPVFTEAPVVPQTFIFLLVGVDVQVNTLWVGTLPELRVEEALGHFLEIVLVYEFTLLPLFTESS